MSENISRDDFAAQLNTKFRVFREPLWVECELTEVTKAKINPNQEQFGLIFLMPEDFPIEQGSFSFEHEKLGSMEIFAVPIAKESGGVVFEAIFNRVVPQS